MDDQFCLLFLRGCTVRSIAIRFNVPKSTVHYRLQKRLGKRCQSARLNGSFLIIEESLQKLPRLQQASVRRWMAVNLDQIVAVDERYNTRLLTTKQEQELTNQECGSNNDFRQGIATNYVA